MNTRDHGAVSFVTVSDLIRDKSIRYDENMGDYHPFVISTSFMTGDDDGTVNVKDEDLDTLDDCFDYTKNSNSDKEFLQPVLGHRGLLSQTIKNSSQLATSQFLENSSLEKQRLLACQVTPVLSKSTQNTKVFILQGVPKYSLILILLCYVLLYAID